MFRYAVFEKVNYLEYVMIKICMTKKQAEAYRDSLACDVSRFTISPTELREIPKDIFTTYYSEENCNGR